MTIHVATPGYAPQTAAKLLGVDLRYWLSSSPTEGTRLRVACAAAYPDQWTVWIGCLDVYLITLC